VKAADGSDLRAPTVIVLVLVRRVLPKSVQTILYVPRLAKRTVRVWLSPGRRTRVPASVTENDFGVRPSFRTVKRTAPTGATAEDRIVLASVNRTTIATGAGSAGEEAPGAASVPRASATSAAEMRRLVTCTI
jgi:hypothetical protein